MKRLKPLPCVLPGWQPLASLVLASLMLLIPGMGAQAAGLLIADGGFGGVLVQEEHDVKVTINNGIAVTQVTQVFRNTERRQLEALYTFPVPKGASVANFSMWIQGKEMVGEVVEKERARQIYNSYKQKRQDPGLLEQTDYKTFEMRIFPIGPEALQKVQICYYQELDFDHDWATYVYPLATASRAGLDSRVQGRFSVGLDIKSPLDISQVASPSHPNDFLFTPHSSHFHEASLEVQQGELARDVVLAFQVKRPFTGLDLLTSRQAGEDGYFMLTLTAGEELVKEQRGADYLFILDISGSMANSGKLTTSVRSLAAFIQALGPEDRFEVITFNRQPHTLFGSLQASNDDNSSKALTFLQTQEARGGTALRPALATAFKYGNPDRPLNTVILSDGMTEQQERRVLLEMSQNRPQNSRIFCIGVGNEVNRSLLAQLAQEAGGLAAFISGGDDFKRQAKAFRRKLLHPVASNVQINFSGLDVYDVEPQTIPNLYHGSPIRIYGRYRGEDSGTLQLQATVNGRQISSQAQLNLPGEDGANPEIERMWAWHRMENLKRQHEVRADQQKVNEIISLGETYSITSEYTSFLVLENDAEYRRWKIKRRNASRLQRDRAAQQQLRQELQRLREQSLAKLGPAQEEMPAQQVKPDPVAQRPSSSAPQPSRPAARPTSRPGTSIDLPSLGGGGAMDPVSAGLAALVALGALSRRKR